MKLLMTMIKYNSIKENLLRLKEWIYNHPKKVYRYVMVVLVISFGLIFIQYYFFTPQVSTGIKIPTMYSESDQVKADMEKSDQKMNVIVNELQSLKKKRESGPLSKNDSLRIEYLFHQYQTLKNGL
ncbi:hypothetical protein ACM44_02020 [Chryseobacterium koreense CCUG 49689]|uniref:Uncharacterized protein n=2 Tax=Chryseobacterium koreense TaxID=232216 RepID=A0A0J7LTJ7_9FLAO|nr:hypothetical protein ACM44_02020 [Chryseobacterium koreense CCUG 49689]